MGIDLDESRRDDFSRKERISGGLEVLAQNIACSGVDCPGHPDRLLRGPCGVDFRYGPNFCLPDRRSHSVAAVN